MEKSTTKAIAALLDESAVAGLLGVSRYCLQAWRVRGGGPRFIAVGRCVRYREADVLAWLDSRTRSSTSEELRV